MTAFPTLSRKHSGTLSPCQQQPTRSRTQRALSRLTRLRLPSMRDAGRPPTPLAPPKSTSASPRTPPTVSPADRPLKQVRRQSRSFSTFFSSPLSPCPTTSLAASQAQAQAQSPTSARRLGLKRTTSFPALIEYPKAAQTTIFAENVFADVTGDEWGAPRDVTIRLEKAHQHNESTFTPFSRAAAMDLLPCSTPTQLATPETPRSFYPGSAGARVPNTPPTWSGLPEISRFSSSTEADSRDASMSMSVSSCASSPPLAPLSLSRCAVLDVFTAPRDSEDSVGEPLDLDFELEKSIPFFSPPPSPEEHRYQRSVVSHAEQGHGEDSAMASPTPAPRHGPGRWSFAASSSSSHDVMDPAMYGFSYAATPAVVVFDPAAAGRRALTPPPTPCLAPVAADSPSPFLLPRQAEASQSLFSLGLEELTCEMDKVGAVELPCGFEFPSTPVPPFPSFFSSSKHPVPFPASAPSTPRVNDRPDTPTPFTFPSFFPFHCPSPPPGSSRKPSHAHLAALTTGTSSPSPLPRTHTHAHVPSPASSTSSLTCPSSPPLSSTSTLPLSPFSLSDVSTSESGSSALSSEAPTSPASVPTAYYPRDAGRRRPKHLPLGVKA